MDLLAGFPGIARDFISAARANPFGRVSLESPLSQEQIGLRYRWSRIMVALAFLITFAGFYQDILWSQHHPTVLATRTFSAAMALGAGAIAAMISSVVFSVSGLEVVTEIEGPVHETLSLLVSGDKVASEFFATLHQMPGRVLVYREYQLLMRRAEQLGCHPQARKSRALIADFLKTAASE